MGVGVGEEWGDTEGRLLGMDCVFAYNFGGPMQPGGTHLAGG